MIPPADIAGVKSPVFAGTTTLAAASATASTTANVAQGALGNLTPVAVGQLVQAQVLTQLQDGTFLVSVGNNVLRMALPADTDIGGTLPMTLLATEPRPTYLVGQQDDTSSALLSNAAKVINSVLQSAQQSGAPATLVGKTPLLPAAAANPSQIAAGLHDSIEFSGLFYESHVGQWVDGQRPFSDLLQEPQFQAPTGEAATAAASAGKSQVSSEGTLLQSPATTEAGLSKLIDDARAASDGQSKLGQALNTLSSARSLPQEADTVVRSPTLNQETAQTINLQLNTLEQNRVAWQGELWPGQQLEWEISDQTKHGGQQGSADDGQTSWQSVVRFDLPKLGKISASINLAGGHVQVHVRTTSATAAAALKTHGHELATAMDAAGSPLDSLIIKQDEQA